MLTDVITELKNSVTSHLFLNKKYLKEYVVCMHAFLREELQILKLLGDEVFNFERTGV